MPPASFVAGAVGACAAVAASFTLPSQTKEGDTVVAIVGAPLPNVGPAVAGTTWAIEAAFANGGGTFGVWVLRRPALADELGNVAISFPAGFGSGGLALIEVYRNLNTGSAIVASGSADVAASTNFPCPSRMLTSYSDLYVGIVFVTDAAIAVTAPIGGTMRTQTTGGGRSLASFDYLAEATGATGVRTATIGVAHNGMASSVALAANPVIGFGKSFSLSPVGTIGLPAEGI